MKRINILYFFRLLISSCVFSYMVFLIHINTSIAEGTPEINNELPTEGQTITGNIEDTSEEVIEEETVKVPLEEDYQLSRDCDDPACYDEYYYISSRDFGDDNVLPELRLSMLLQPTISYHVYCERYKIYEDKIRCSKVDCLYVIPILNVPDYEKIEDKGIQIAKNCRMIEMDKPVGMEIPYREKMNEMDRENVSVKDNFEVLDAGKYYLVEDKAEGKPAGYYSGRRKPEEFSNPKHRVFCSAAKDRIISRYKIKHEINKTGKKEEVVDAEIRKELYEGKDNPEPCIIRETNDEVAAELLREMKGFRL